VVRCSYLLVGQQTVFDLRRMYHMSVCYN
jgi:hypothetical protein